MKIMKLRKRRNIDFNQKICKNCGKEYLENDNYNWSCRTHRVSLKSIHYVSQSMEERCGGAAENHHKMRKAANIQSMNPKMKMKKIRKTLKKSRIKPKRSNAFVARKKVIRLKTVLKIRICELIRMKSKSYSALLILKTKEK